MLASTSGPSHSTESKPVSVRFTSSSLDSNHPGAANETCARPQAQAADFNVHVNQASADDYSSASEDCAAAEQIASAADEAATGAPRAKRARTHWDVRAMHCPAYDILVLCRLRPEARINAGTCRLRSA
jgi:hypothetical protein